MRNRAIMMSLMAAAMMMEPLNSPAESNRGRKYVPEKDHKKPIPKGHKEFNIDGQIVYALNYKNALKKIKKKPLL